MAAILGPEAAFDVDEREPTPEIKARALTGELPASWEPALRMLLEAEGQPETTGADSTDPEAAGEAISLVSLPVENMRLVGGFLLDAPDMDGSVPDVPLVPVLAHQQEAFGRFVEHVQEHPDKPVRRPERFFEDTPNPWPPQIHLVALRAAVAARSFRWVDLEAPVGLAVGVERLRANANSVPPRRTPNESAR